jgi:hypothetical protein
MACRGGDRRRWGVAGAIAAAAAAAAAVAAGCGEGLAPRVATPCPVYRGGTATPAVLAGNYTLVSFCQDTLPALGPAQGVTGTLVMTVGTPDSFQATVNLPGQAPVQLAGPYTLSHDTIAVNLQIIQFVATYTLSSATDTLYVSGTLPGTSQGLAIVFAKTPAP